MRLALAAALLATLVFAPSAEAFKTFGSWRWPGKTITYHDGTGKQYKDEVAAAARAWNTSGVKVKWKKVSSKSKAQVPIIVKKIPTAGIAWHLGRGRGRIEIQPRLKKSRQTEAAGARVAVQVIAHEMGHIMGLDHETKKCAVMQPMLGVGCPNPKVPWQYRCRVLETDDLRGGVKLFGGKVGKVGPEFCDSVPPPPEPTGVSVAPTGSGEDGEGGVTVSWTTPAGEELAAVQVMRRRDVCPTGLDDKQAKVVGSEPANAGQSQSTIDYAGFPAAGRYCYAVIVIGAYNRPSKGATFFYEHTGPASPAYSPQARFYWEYADGDETAILFEDGSAPAEDDGSKLVKWHWDFADGSSFDGPNPPPHTFPPGKHSVTLTVTDDRGRSATFTDVVYVDAPVGDGEDGR